MLNPVAVNRMKRKNEGYDEFSWLILKAILSSTNKYLIWILVYDVDMTIIIGQLTKYILN